MKIEVIFNDDEEYWNMLKQIAIIHEKIKLNANKIQIDLILSLENSIAKMHAYREDAILKNLTENITERLEI